MVVSVAPGFEANVQAGAGALVDQLTARLLETDAAIAVASPFARGGRLRGSSWLARSAIAWENGFLSLAAHGELATVIGTVRVLRRGVLEDLTRTHVGMDPDAALLLEARKRGFRITEVPADLTTSPSGRPFSFGSFFAAGARSIARLRTGLHYRPALWLALPGLVPGLLPLVIGLLLLFRATPAQATFWTIVTLVVQYGSLALFSWQTTSFVAKRWQRGKAA